MNLEFGLLFHRFLALMCKAVSDICRLCGFSTMLITQTSKKYTLPRLTTVENCKPDKCKKYGNQCQEIFGFCRDTEVKGQVNPCVVV